MYDILIAIPVCQKKQLQRDQIIQLNLYPSQSWYLNVGLPNSRTFYIWLSLCPFYICLCLATVYVLLERAHVYVQQQVRLYCLWFYLGYDKMWSRAAPKQKASCFLTQAPGDISLLCLSHCRVIVGTMLTLTVHLDKVVIVIISDVCQITKSLSCSQMLFYPLVDCR